MTVTEERNKEQVRYDEVSRLLEHGCTEDGRKKSDA